MGRTAAFGEAPSIPIKFELMVWPRRRRQPAAPLPGDCLQRVDPASVRRPPKFVLPIGLIQARKGSTGGVAKRLTAGSTAGLRGVAGWRRVRPRSYLTFVPDTQGTLTGPR